MKPLNEPARYKREEAGVWRPEIPPEDTAPPAPPPGPSLEEWGVTRDEARAMLNRQMCPVCGSGPWKSPLNHASRKHGIDRFTMRDLCGLTTTVSVTAPEFRERLVERGRATDMTAANEAARRRKRQRFTSAGLEVLSANLRAFSDSEAGAAQRLDAARASKTPEAQAKRSATIRAKRRP